MIPLLFLILATPCAISTSYELTRHGRITTLVPTQHNLYRAYELVTSPYSCSLTRTKFTLNLIATMVAVIAVAIGLNTAL